MRKVCIFTGTRAEYGLLKPLIDKINSDSDLKLLLIVSGMHLSPEFGLTFQKIEKDGFNIDEKIEILMSSDTPVGLCKSMGIGLISFSEALDRLCPDILVILGDRFESFAMASAAMILRIPIAHLHGGEATYGVIDEPIRHSITKMSHLHFTSTEDYRRRVIQLGENPDRVYNVGAIGIDSIKSLSLLSRKKFEEIIDFSLGKLSMLVTFHPVTLEDSTAAEQFGELLAAIDELITFRVIFTKSNADTNGRVINQMIDEYVEKNSDRTIVFTSMGQLRYLSALQFVDAVVGNSSSGIIEAPSFNVPTVNIGDRQKGRICAESVIDCEPKQKMILNAIETALSIDFQERLKKVKNPYEQVDTANRIMEVLKTADINSIIKKEFFNNYVLPQDKK